MISESQAKLAEAKLRFQELKRDRGTEQTRTTQFKVWSSAVMVYVFYRGDASVTSASASVDSSSSLTSEKMLVLSSESIPISLTDSGSFASSLFASSTPGESPRNDAVLSVASLDPPLGYFVTASGPMLASSSAKRAFGGISSWRHEAS